MLFASDVTTLVWMTLMARAMTENMSNLSEKGWPMAQPTSTHRGMANSAICRQGGGGGWAGTVDGQAGSECVGQRQAGW